MNYEYWAVMIAIASLAITGVLVVAPQNINIFAAIVLGIITSIGGGTVRDVILDVPIFWSQDLNYIWVALGGSLAAFAAHRFFNRRRIYNLILYLDALGIALFAIQSSHKVWVLDFGWPLAPIILGVITAIGGGIVRDLLAGRPTFLMDHELYASPVVFGCTLYVLILKFLPKYELFGARLCVMLILGLRSAAIYWRLNVPPWLILRPKRD
ncbi:MAG: TRIC cation channel family protein [Cyanobacteria bacterium J06592_8]